MKRFLTLALVLSLVFALAGCLPAGTAGTTTADGGDAGTAGLLMPIILLVVMFAAMYFFIIRPQKKQEKETAAMLNALSVGDTVSTVGGIIGIVLKIKDDMVLIETGADRTHIQLAKWAIRKVEEKANE